MSFDLRRLQIAWAYNLSILFVRTFQCLFAFVLRFLMFGFLEASWCLHGNSQMDTHSRCILGPVIYGLTNALMTVVCRINFHV